MNAWLDDLNLSRAELGVAALASVATVALGAAALALSTSVKERRLVVGRSRGESTEDVHEASRIAESLGSVGRTVASGRFSRQLGIQLARAGFSSDSAAAIFIGAKTVFFLVGLALGAMAAIALRTSFHAGLFVTAFTGTALFVLPNLYVAARRDARLGELRRRLPDAIDLLEICVSSGMGLDIAWNAVAQEVRRVSTPLANEMELTRLEVSLGVPRARAMRHMSERTGLDDISSLVALLVQAERFGASIVEALRTFATTMREVQSKRAEESAEKMAVKLLFPMVLFIFPTLLIVMVGPAVIRIADVMG